VSLRQRAEAEAAMALESLAGSFLARNPGFAVRGGTLDPSRLVGELFTLAGGTAADIERGAALFHLCLASGLAARALEAAHVHQAKAVAFGGGCFLNRVLARQLGLLLQAGGLTVLEAGAASCSDAGLALGQAWAASAAVGADALATTLGQVL
jgi:hydrogenase maturation protein HypF